jgi:hypothetical protein
MEGLPLASAPRKAPLLDLSSCLCHCRLDARGCLSSLSDASWKTLQEAAEVCHNAIFVMKAPWVDIVAYVTS